MQISFSRGSKQKQELSASLIDFVAEKLVPRLKDKLEINVEFITGLMKREYIYGDCIWEDEDYRPKEFTIRIDAGLDLRNTLTTLAHEMVHVKQYARDEMKQLWASPKIRFDGRYYDIKTDYWDRPWEIEAHGREIGLFIRWAEKHNHSHKPWAQEKV